MMTIKELKEIIAGLPDEAQVAVETLHDEFEWENDCTEDISAVTTPRVRLTIIARFIDK